MDFEDVVECTSVHDPELTIEDVFEFKKQTPDFETTESIMTVAKITLIEMGMKVIEDFYSGDQSVGTTRKNLTELILLLNGAFKRKKDKIVGSNYNLGVFHIFKNT